MFQKFDWFRHISCEFRFDSHLIAIQTSSSALFPTISSWSWSVFAILDFEYGSSTLRTISSFLILWRINPFLLSIGRLACFLCLRDSSQYCYLLLLSFWNLISHGITWSFFDDIHRGRVLEEGGPWWCIYLNTHCLPYIPVQALSSGGIHVSGFTYTCIRLFSFIISANGTCLCFITLFYQLRNLTCLCFITLFY